MSNEQERIAHAEQAKSAMDRFLRPAFDEVTTHWAKRIEEIAGKTPWETDKIKSLAMALRAAREAQSQIEAIIADGQVAVSEMRRKKAIEGLSPERRRWI